MDIKNPTDQCLTVREGTGFHELLNVSAHGAGWGPEGCRGGAEPGPGFCHGIYMSAANVTIDGGRYYNNNGYGMQIYVGNANNTIVRNVRAYDNYSTGIGVFRPNTTVENNLVYNNGAYGIWLKATGGVARHNTSWGNANEGMVADQAPGYTVSDNIVSALVLPGQGVNNWVGGDPQFVNPVAPAWDFHLQPTSPARAAATDGTDQGVNFTTLDGGVPPVTDSTAPSVQITAPSQGALVSGASVAVTATASDNVAVTSLQFFVNGEAKGAPGCCTQLTRSVDTTQVANGLYTLTAEARDQAGNVGRASPIQVLVYNGTPQPPGAAHPTMACSGTIQAVPGRVDMTCTPQAGKK